MAQWKKREVPDQENVFGVVKECDADGEMEMKVNEEPGRTQLLTHNEPVWCADELRISLEDEVHKW